MSDRESRSFHLDSLYYPREYRYFTALMLDEEEYFLLVSTEERLKQDFIFVRVIDEEEQEYEPIYDLELMGTLFELFEKQQPEQYQERFGSSFTVTQETLDELEAELNIKICAPVPRLLTEDALTTIRRFHYYQDGKKCCAITGSFTGISHLDADDLDSLIEESENSMESVLGYHPDFTPLVMDDGNWILAMQDNAFCCNSPVEMAGTFHPSEYSPFNVPISAALHMRGDCMTACQLSRVLAVVYFDVNEYYEFNETEA